MLAVLLAEVLRVPPDLYGWLVSLPFWCYVRQLPIGGFLFSRWPAGAVFVVNIWINSAVVAARNSALGDLPSGGGGWVGQWPAVWAARPFLAMVLFGCFLGRVVNAAYGAFQPLFVLSVLFGALALPVWGRLIARYGARSGMFCALALWTVITFAWAFLTLRTRWLLYPAWAFSGAASAGIVLGQLNLLMKLMPPAARAGAVSIERRKPRHRRGALDLMFVIRTSIRIEHVSETGFAEWKR